MRKLTGTLYLMLGLSLLLAAPTWADFQAGLDAYDRGDYETALNEYRPFADQGYATAQFNLGLMYASGQGVYRRITPKR